LHLVGYLYYWQMGFNSVFKGLTPFSMGDLIASAHLCLLTANVTSFSGQVICRFCRNLGLDFRCRLLPT